MKMKNHRALSFSILPEYGAMMDYYVKNAPDKPVHRPVQSLFTTSSGFNNFRGLLNLTSLLMVITTLRMALENVSKYGILIDPFSWIRFICQTEQKFAIIGLLGCTNVFIMFAWLMELAIMRKLVNRTLSVLLIFWNMFCSIAFPTGMIVSLDIDPLISFPILFIYTVVFLKLWSYAAVNNWCRQAGNCSTTSYKTNKSSKIRSEVNEMVNKSFDYENQIPFSMETCNTDIPSSKVTDSVITHSSEAMHENSEAETNASNFAGVEHNCEIRWRNSNWTNRKPCHQTVNSGKRISVLDAPVCDWSDDPVELEIDRLVHQNVYARLRQDVYLCYPANLTIKNIYYFMLVPTLCYELNFPQTFTIRKRFLCKRLLELVILSQLILCLIQQWCLPLLKNSVTPFAESNMSLIVELCLKLAIPNHLIWLLFFYLIFHSFLNVMGELTYFSDRFFYSDWWNASSVQDFWSKWNIPVHRFARRHIYIPLQTLGFSRLQASIVVFSMSAFFHEFLVSLPLKMPRLWAFCGMLSQLPLACTVSYLWPNGGPYGNVAVWFVLIIGQPLIVLFYFHDYYISRYS